MNFVTHIDRVCLMCYFFTSEITRQAILSSANSRSFFLCVLACAVIRYYCLCFDDKYLLYCSYQRSWAISIKYMGLAFFTTDESYPPQISAYDSEMFKIEILKQQSIYGSRHFLQVRDLRFICVQLVLRLVYNALSCVSTV